MVRRELQGVEQDGVAGRNGHLAREVPEAVIDEVAGEIAVLVRRAELRCAFEVGRLVVERFFGGDLGAWHKPGPKSHSLARLAERLQARGAGSAATLHVCLGVFETLAPLGEDSTWNHLTRSHVRAVLALPQPARASLLREAEERGWTVAQLEEASAQTPRVRRGGPPRSPAFLRALALAERLFARDGLAFRELERLVTFEESKQAAIHARAIRFAERVDAFRLRVSPKRLAEIGSGQGAPAGSARGRRAKAESVRQSTLGTP